MSKLREQEKSLVELLTSLSSNSDTVANLKSIHEDARNSTTTSNIVPQCEVSTSRFPNAANRAHEKRAAFEMEQLLAAQCALDFNTLIESTNNKNEFYERQIQDLQDTVEDALLWKNDVIKFAKLLVKGVTKFVPNDVMLETEKSYLLTLASSLERHLKHNFVDGSDGVSVGSTQCSTHVSKKSACSTKLFSQLLTMLSTDNHNELNIKGPKPNSLSNNQMEGGGENAPWSNVNRYADDEISEVSFGSISQISKSNNSGVFDNNTDLICLDIKEDDKKVEGKVVVVEHDYNELNSVEGTLGETQSSSSLPKKSKPNDESDVVNMMSIVKGVRRKSVSNINVAQEAEKMNIGRRSLTLSTTSLPPSDDTHRRLSMPTTAPPPPPPVRRTSANDNMDKSVSANDDRRSSVPFADYVEGVSMDDILNRRMKHSDSDDSSESETSPKMSAVAPKTRRMSIAAAVTNASPFAHVIREPSESSGSDSDDSSFSSLSDHQLAKSTLRNTSVAPKGRKCDKTTQTSTVDTTLCISHIPKELVYVPQNCEAILEEMFHFFINIEGMTCDVQGGSFRASRNESQWMSKKTFTLLGFFLNLYDENFSMAQALAIFDKSSVTNVRGQAKFSSRLNLNDFVTVVKYIATCKYSTSRIPVDFDGEHDVNLIRFVKYAYQYYIRYKLEDHFATRMLNTYNTFGDIFVFQKLAEFEPLLMKAFSRSKNYHCCALDTSGGMANGHLKSILVHTTTNDHSLGSTKPKAVTYKAECGFEAFCMDYCIYPDLVPSALVRRISLYMRSTNIINKGTGYFYGCLAHLLGSSTSKEFSRSTTVYEMMLKHTSSPTQAPLVISNEDDMAISTSVEFPKKRENERGRFRSDTIRKPVPPACREIGAEVVDTPTAAKQSNLLKSPNHAISNSPRAPKQRTSVGLDLSNTITSMTGNMSAFGQFSDSKDVTLQGSPSLSPTNDADPFSAEKREKVLTMLERVLIHVTSPTHQRQSYQS